jgi:hypothetical protein
MRKLALLLAGISLIPFTHVLASEPPRGSLLELHSCELFAGGCVVSSEATLGGRYMLQAWNFTGGSFAGSDLAGLQLAVLHASSQNLAFDKSVSEQAIVYLPEKATAKQRKALLAWAASKLADSRTKIQTRVAALKFTKSTDGYTFSAGKSISVTAASPSLCESGGCGEELWYTPRVTTSVFTVAVDRSAQVKEPLLKLNWRDSGKRCIFLARFGETSSAPNAFLTSGDLCGPTETLF